MILRIDIIKLFFLIISHKFVAHKILRIFIGFVMSCIFFKGADEAIYSIHSGSSGPSVGNNNISEEKK